ncbi:MAG: type IX secretion system membrane protein PorP/SprF, partial [bacterium]
IKNGLKRCKRFLIITIYHILFSFIVFISTNVRAQEFTIYNPVEISQPWVSEINPAVITSQYSRVSVGLKVFHFGFLPDKNLGLNESHINASFPFHLPIGIGCDLRYFSAGIYSELEGSILLSKKIIEQFSIGVKIGLERIGFGRQDFNIVDANDPLLVGNLSKTCLNLGLGAYWNYGQWSFGFGIDHVNRPDMGFQTNAILPQQICAGIGYKSGKFMPTLLFQIYDKWISYGLAVSMIHDRFGLIRLSFENTMPIKMEVQFNVSKDNSLQYGIDFPTKELRSVSVGSHEIVYNHILGRGPDIGQPRILISSDTMKIYEECVVRSMPDELSTDLVANVDGLIPEYLEVNRNLRNLLVVPTGVLNQYETDTIKCQRYINLGKLIAQRLQQNPGLNVILHTDDKSLADARTLKVYLLKKGIIPSQKINIAKLNSAGRPKLDGFVPGRQNVSYKKPVCSNKTLVITLPVTGRTRRVRDWNLTIINDRKEVIKTYNGKDKLPDRLEWDWNDQWGELVDPGRYLCFLSLRGTSGQKRISLSPPIQIERLHRTIMLRFSLDSQSGKNKIDLKYGHFQVSSLN